MKIFATIFIVICALLMVRVLYVHAQTIPKKAERESINKKIDVTVPEKEGRSLMDAASESEQLKAIAQVAQETAQAAQKVADGYNARAALARRNYDALYYKLVSDMHIDTDRYQLDRKDDKLYFVLKDGKKDEKTTGSPGSP